MGQLAKSLPKDEWTIVLSNVTYAGQVHIEDDDEELVPNKPTTYLLAMVPTGDPAPSADYADGIKIKKNFSPANSSALDYYMKPVDFAGRVIIIT